VRGLLVALAMLTAVPGCALFKPESPSSRQLREIVAEIVEATRATAKEQVRRVANARAMYDAVPSEENGVRYAALLAMLPPPAGNDDQAAAVLRPIAAHRSGSPLNRLAAMLAAGVTERQRLARELRAVERRAEAEARRAESAQAQADAAERREAAANERANTLQGQVDALKSIERSILKREERRRTLKR
jgi:hypothetical protein